MINPAYELLASGENPAADPIQTRAPTPAEGRARRSAGADRDR